MSTELTPQDPTNLATTPLEQQKKIALLRRQIAENDFQFQLLVMERNVLLSQINDAVTCYRDALGADRLREQGAAAVAEAMEICEVTL